MAKVLYLDSVAGVAGDMFTAAFVDAGLVSVEELNELPIALGLRGVEIVAEKVLRASVEATRMSILDENGDWKQRLSGHHHHGHEHNGHTHLENTNLILDDHAEHWHVHYTEIDAAIRDSSLALCVKELARKILRILGEAEASVHGVAIERAAFHELGTLDSILDVVMAAYCLEKVGARDHFATPIKPGRGRIKIAHGTHAVPPPASLRLLTGLETAVTPAAITAESIELSTPTGIAILRSLEPTFVFEMPAGQLVASGRGSGTKDLGDYPNVFQIALVETTDSLNELPYLTDSVVEITCNIDDDTAEHLAWMCETLLELGALDVWQTPGTGKKGRMMTCLSVLAKPSNYQSLADWILRNGTTFGIRYRSWDRLMLDREIETHTKNGREVRYKIGRTTDGEKLKEKAEFDDWRSS